MQEPLQVLRPIGGAKLRRAVSELLRNLDRPQRLRSNPLALYYSRNRSALESDYWVPRALRTLVSQSVAALPPRQRTIVERCDLAGELHSAVIESLAISEAHFYRERRAALDFVALRLTTRSNPRENPRATVTLDGLAAALVRATSLEQAGAVEEATALLARAASACDDAGRKKFVLARLAELYANAGRPADALRLLSVPAVCSVDETDHAAAVVVEATRAYAMYRAGEESVALGLAARHTVTLRSLLMESPTASVAEALALLAEIIFDRSGSAGTWGVARQTLAQVLELVRRVPGVRSSVRSRLALDNATAKAAFPEMIGEAARDLELLLDEATALGLASEIGSIAGALVDVYTLQQRVPDAIAFIEPLLDAIRSASPAHVVSGVLLDLAVAYLKAGRWVEALQAVDEIRRHSPPGSYPFASSYLVESEAWLCAGRPQTALESASGAIESMTRLKRDRYVGSGLRLQALALAAIGNREQARTVINEACDRLRGIAHPFIVERAERDAARISGRLRQRRA